MQRIIKIGVAFSLVFLYGCAVPTKLSKSERAQINTVTISKYTNAPQKVIYEGSNVQWGKALGGVIGGLIIESTGNMDDVVTEAFSRKNIYIGNYVLGGFYSEFKKNSPFELVERNGDGAIQLQIERYGFASVNPFSSDVRPFVDVRAEMRNSSDKVVWRKSVFKYGDDSDSIKNWLDEPNQLEDALTELSGEISAELIQDLTTDKSPHPTM